MNGFVYANAYSCIRHNNADVQKPISSSDQVARLDTIRQGKWDMNSEKRKAKRGKPQEVSKSASGEVGRYGMGDSGVNVNRTT